MTSIKALGVIPARYQSSRFPGKPLAKIAGKTLLQRVWERTCTAQTISEVIIATDDDRILEAAQSFGAQALLTSSEHKSGSDRTAEVVTKCQAAGKNFDFIANIQGDMPFINPKVIDRVIAELAQATPLPDIATVAVPITTAEEFNRAAAVKVVLTQNNRALYFSRAPIPVDRGGDVVARTKQFSLRHIGLYVFCPTSLLRLTALPEGVLENLEKLEQLRALENNMSIYVTVVDRDLLEPNIEVDTPEDLERADAYCRKMHC